MRVCLLDHLLQRRQGRPRHVVEEDVLRRVRDINGAIRPIERVLTGGEDGQRLAVRTESRAHGHAGDEIGVSRQPRVQMRLHRVVDRGRRHPMAAGQTAPPGGTSRCDCRCLRAVDRGRRCRDCLGCRRPRNDDGSENASTLAEPRLSAARSGTRIVWSSCSPSSCAQRGPIRLSYRNSRRTRRAGS